MARLRDVLIESIKARRTLAFTYNGRRRIVEPQCLGLGSKGRELLRAHQIEGGQQKEPLFDVARIEDFVALDRHFTKPGPNYKKGDSAMRTIFAEL